MKLLSLLSLALFCSVGFQPSGLNKAPGKLTPAVTELTDLKDIAFARNLLTWKDKKVDSLVLDIYYPTGATSNKKYPLLMFYHAGGFMGGNRFNVMTVCDRFADEGFISVAIDYRVGYDKVQGHDCKSDSATFDNAIYRSVQDANAAIRYLVARADSFHIDTSWIFTAGSSAGGMVAYTQAFWSDSTAQRYFPKCYNLLGSINTSGNNYPANYRIKGVCNMWGALAHAAELIDAGYRPIPCIIFKGQEDGGFPDSAGHFGGCRNMPYVYAGVSIYDYLTSQHIPSVFHYLPQAGHSAFDNGFCVQQASCFFRSLINGTATSAKFVQYQSSCP